MDEFWTAAEIAFRSRAADLFRNLPDPLATGPDWPAEEIWRALDGLVREEPESNLVSPASLSSRVSVLDEASHRDPRLGRQLLDWLERSGPLDPPRRAACELGRLAGTAAHVLAAGTVAAREKGFFSSILMDFRVAQESLAGLVAGAELARLGACRLCRLLDKGETTTAGREAAGLEARALALAADINSVGGSLLGSSWTQARLAAAAAPSSNERT